MRTIQTEEVLNAVYQRRAIRQYTNESVDAATISGLIDAAIQAPSAMNLQPWSFVVVLGSQRLRGYSARIKAHLANAPDGAAAEWKEFFSDESDVFHGAPALVVVCATSPGTQAAEDCALAAQNLMLAAFASGLGTCPIGFARPWLCLPEVKRELGIPDDLVPGFSSRRRAPGGAPRKPRPPPRAHSVSAALKLCQAKDGRPVPLRGVSICEHDRRSLLPYCVLSQIESSERSTGGAKRAAPHRYGAVILRPPSPSLRVTGLRSG